MSSPGSDTGSFAEALPALKQRGCSVLLVGAVPDSVHKRACQQLLGDDTAETRRRLLVRPESEEGVGIAAITDADSSMRVIEHDLSTRESVVEVDGCPEAAGPEMGESEPNGLSGRPSPSEIGAASRFEGDEGREFSELQNRISAAIAEIEASAGTLSPAELRVCFAPVLSLGAAHSHEAVARLLRLVFAEVRGVRGMGHCHLPVAHDAEVVDALYPLFDAVVDLRVESDNLQERWHLNDGPSSEWLPLPSSTTDMRGDSQ